MNRFLKAVQTVMKISIKNIYLSGFLKPVHVATTASVIEIWPSEPKNTDFYFLFTGKFYSTRIFTYK
jgi:hypothetical protein